MSKTLNEVYIQACTDKAVELGLTDGIGVDARMTELRQAGLEAVAAEALRRAASWFKGRLPDGTGNGRAYNSYTVARILEEMAVSETEGVS